MLAEQKAYELCEKQKSWSLVTILPSVVQGPPPGVHFFCSAALLQPVGRHYFLFIMGHNTTPEDHGWLSAIFCKCLDTQAV